MLLTKCQLALKLQQNWSRRHKLLSSQKLLEYSYDSDEDNDLTSLQWLQNPNIMSAFPDLPTPPTSPVPMKKQVSVLNYSYSKGKKCGTTHYPSRPKFMDTPPQDDVDYRISDRKPPYSYATLIYMAMKDSGKKMTLSQIYSWIREHFRYYQKADPSWQNSIRHNLSLNKCFMKVARGKDEPGKGGFWTLDTAVINGLSHGNYRKQKLSDNRISSRRKKDQRRVKCSTMISSTHQQPSSMVLPSISSFSPLGSFNHGMLELPHPWGIPSFPVAFRNFPGREFTLSSPIVPQDITWSSLWSKDADALRLRNGDIMEGRAALWASHVNAFADLVNDTVLDDHPSSVELFVEERLPSGNDSSPSFQQLVPEVTIKNEIGINPELSLSGSHADAVPESDREEAQMLGMMDDNADFDKFLEQVLEMEGGSTSSQSSDSN